MGEPFDRDQSYFPGCKLRLTLRLEEYANVLPGVTDTSQVVPPQARQGAHAQAQSSKSLSVVPDPTAPPGVTRFLLQSAAGGTAPGGPQQADRSSDGFTQLLGAVVPHSCRIGRNGWKQGDTCDVSFRWTDLPLDPRVFRSVAVEVYMGTVSQQDFSAGVAGGVRAASQGGNQVAERLHVVPDAWTDPAGRPRTNLRFRGWVDDWEYEWARDGQATVHLRCTDNTRLLQDMEVGPKTTFDASKPLDQAVAQLLANYPQLAGLTVEYRPAVGSASIPVLSKVLQPAAYRLDLAGPGPAAGGGTTSGGRHSLWDYVVQLMLLVGHTARMEDTTLVIQRVRTATGKGFPQRAGDPFTGRTWGSGQHPLRTLIWGRNVLSAKVSRRYAFTRRAVECRCYDVATKTVLMARHPKDKSQRPTSLLPGDGRSDTKYLVVPVYGVKDLSTLQAVAQHYYEGMNRAELRVSLETRNLASYGAGNEDPDLLDMLPGDRFEYLVDRVDPLSLGTVGNTLGEYEQALLDPGAGAGLLAQIGMADEAATKYLEAYRSKNFQTEYVVRAMGLDWDRDKGISIQVEGVNFVEVALDSASGFDDAQLIPQTQTTSQAQSSLVNPSGSPTKVPLPGSP